MATLGSGTHEAPASAGSEVVRRLRAAGAIPIGITRVSSDQRGAWDRMGGLLSALGHEVVERDPAYGLAQVELLQTWQRGIYEASLTLSDRTRLERFVATDGCGRSLSGTAVAPPAAARASVCHQRADHGTLG